MSELFHVSFDYDVIRGPFATTALRRGRAAIEVATLQAQELAVAYRVEDQRHLGPGRHPVLRYGGRLWWPLAETAPQLRTARDFQGDLRDGRSDLFLQRGLDHLFLESRRRRSIIHDGHDEALAAVHRNAADLLIVDDHLYAAGGVPLIVEFLGRARVANTGPDRNVTARAGALRIGPANGHWRGGDLAICGGRFYRPDSVSLEIATERRPSRFRGLGIETLDSDVIDQAVVRIDAGFRAAWAAMHRSIPRTRPQGFGALRAKFVEALGPADGEYLTTARYRALQRFVELFAAAERKPVAVTECLAPVQRTLSAVQTLNRFRDLGPELSLSDDDAAALACLA